MSTAATDFKVATLEAKVRELNDTIDEQREEIRQLREVIGGSLAADAFPEWARCLTESERMVCQVLATGRWVSRDGFMATMYGARPDPPNDKVIEVFIHRIRRKLADRVTIESKWGVGWRFTPETVALFKPKAEAA